MKRIREIRSCFLSYPYGKRPQDLIFRNTVIPVLRQLGIKPHDITVELHPGDNIYDTIVRLIRSSDCFVCDISDRTPNIIYELGLVHAWGIPSIVLCQRTEHVPMDIITKYPTILYNTTEAGINRLEEHLFVAFDTVASRRSLYTPTLRRYVRSNESIAFEVYSEKINPIEIFGFISDILFFFDVTCEIGPISLQEVRVGTFGSWISSNFESITRLVEKIIFFIPEWKMKNAERLKVNAETERILAEADAIRRDSDRKDAQQLIEVLEKARHIGEVRVTIGDQLMIDCSEDGLIEIGPPTEEETEQKDNYR